MDTKQTSIRLSDIDRNLLDKLSDRLGITQTAVIKLAIRRLAEQEHIRVKRDKEGHV